MMLNNKLEKLENILKTYTKITVALSGGVDSAFLLAFACKVLGPENVKAVTASGPHLAQDEIEYAKSLCEGLDVEHTVVNMDHIMPILTPNQVDRCYHCKKAMFGTLKELSDKVSTTVPVLADGTNMDDMNDYRPGHKALAELKIASPLKDASLTKSDIRAALHEMAQKDPHLADASIMADGTSIWDKPAFACLASRIPYGEVITEEKLASVYNAEVFLRKLGLKQVRVRHHGDIARIEVTAEDMSRFYEKDFTAKVDSGIKNCGFKFVTLDLGGYKMGGGFHDGQNKRQL